MQLFTPPATQYKNYYEQGAFNLTWKANALTLLIYPFLIIAGALTNMESFVAAFICWLMPIVSLVILKKTRRYEIVAYSIVGLSCLLNGLVLNSHVLKFHVLEYLFMVAVIIYSFITLRRKVGIIVTCIEFVWIVIFLLNQPEEPQVATVYEGALTILPVMVVLTLIAFLVVSFLQQRKDAELKYVEINQALISANHMVNARNKEKTVMLKEIHHRVKNNLQVISSLLRLQSYEIEEENSRVHFQNAVHRVAAMALIHEQMYQNENLSKINLKNYVDTLAADLVRNHAHDVDIELNVHSEIEDLGNDTLVPVALILNELITNSLKHAFTGQSTGTINVIIEKNQKQGYFNFIYKDSGTWKSAVKSNTFGLELIATLIEQLDGEVDRTYENGTKYTFILRDLMRELK